MDKESMLIKLFTDLEPLKKTLSSDPVYKKYRFTFDDVMGFMDDKIIHVFMKYRDTHPYEEIKALCISSMYRVKARIARNNVLVTENIPEIKVEASPETNKISQLIETLAKAISEDQMVLVETIINPPEWVYSKITNEDARIPSRLFLEYFDIEPSPSQVKRLNRFRRRLEFFVRNFIDPYSLKFNKKFLSLIKQRD